MFLTDSLTNLVSGMGTDKDKLQAGRFTHAFVGRDELTAMYTSDWLAAQGVDTPVDDSLREWRTWNAGQRQAARIVAEERRLNVRGRLSRARKLARLHGGSLIILGTGDTDPSRPLDVAAIRQGGLQYLTVLSRWEVTTGPLERDPLSQHYGAPAHYELTADAATVRLHPSRVVRFHGVPPLETAHAIDGWGTSVLARAYDALRNAAMAPQNLAGLSAEAKLDIIKIKGLTVNAQDPAYRGKVLARFGLANLGKSLNNALVLDAEEEWDQKTISPNGWPEAVRLFLEIVAASFDIPVRRLLGAAPVGLSGNGDADIRNYYDMLATQQETDLRPALAWLDEALIRSALGSRPAGVGYSWNPLWQLTAAEQAEIDLKRAQADAIHAELGALPPSALRAGIANRLMQAGTYPGLPEAIAAAAAASEAPAPLVARRPTTPTPAP